METEIFAETVEDVTEWEVITEIVLETETDIISDETTVLETETTVTTADYMAEIASNTARTANCVSYLSGLSVIIIAVLICSVVIKVLFGGHSF